MTSTHEHLLRLAKLYHCELEGVMPIVCNMIDDFRANEDEFIPIKYSIQIRTHSHYRNGALLLNSKPCDVMQSCFNWLKDIDGYDSEAVDIVLTAYVAGEDLYDLATIKLI